jgi:sialate O-acetylesterase
MRIRRILLFSLTIALLPFAGRSEIILGSIFKDGAILQREKPIPVWGRAQPGEKLTITYREQTLNTTVDAAGRWIAYFEAMPGSTEPADLVVTGKDTSVSITDVLVGEVWLASGQSNMEWPVSLLREDEQQIANIDLPLVRHLKVERVVAVEPRDSVTTSRWQSASPETVGHFSAVAYFFARELQRKLGVPVGIIDSSWGGTAIEAWMSDTALQSTSVGTAIEAGWQQAMSEWPPDRVERYKAENEAWQKAQEQARATHTKNPLPWPPPPATDDSPARPAGLFNAMIAPLQPVALRGFLWYQGESNVGRAAEYTELMIALIRSWRSNWGDDTLPFLYVQLPNYANGNPGGREWARLREAQAKVLDEPNTSMAVTIDLGDPDDIHPTTKMEVGRRLALAAKTRLYGIPGDYSGPVFASATREGSTMRVTFTQAGSGLVAHRRPVQSLEIAGEDRVFFVGVGRIDRNMLIVSSPNVKEPVAVRYAWSNAPEANLYDGAGLPAMLSLLTCQSKCLLGAREHHTGAVRRDFHVHDLEITKARVPQHLHQAAERWEKRLTAQRAERVIQRSLLENFPAIFSAHGFCHGIVADRRPNPQRVTLRAHLLDEFPRFNEVIEQPETDAEIEFPVRTEIRNFQIFQAERHSLAAVERREEARLLEVLLPAV